MWGLHSARVPPVSFKCTLQNFALTLSCWENNTLEIDLPTIAKHCVGNYCYLECFFIGNSYNVEVPTIWQNVGKLTFPGFPPSQPLGPGPLPASQNLFTSSHPGLSPVGWQMAPSGNYTYISSPVSGRGRHSNPALHSPYRSINVLEALHCSVWEEDLQ